ncbi:hypothetical protein [Paenibacillus sp. FSL P2-0136]|uniref:hypothetical protein n=1 Tax=Paenibacillus sp. FSL P2-0136 TaxID=2975317 RepID=UPI0030D87FE8
MKALYNERIYEWGMLEHWCREASLYEGEPQDERSNSKLACAGKPDYLFCAKVEYGDKGDYG